MRCFLIALIPLVTFGCASASGKWGGFDSELEGTQFSVKYTAPDLVTFGCDWGWLAKTRDIFQVGCPAEPEAVNVESE